MYSQLSTNERVERLRDAYYALTLASITLVFIVILTGVFASTRPGLPGISRILEDNPTYQPIIYLVFVLFVSELWTVTLIEWQYARQVSIQWNRFAAGWFQTLGLLLIPVASVDYHPIVHATAFVLIVVATIAREVTWKFEGVHASFLFGSHIFGLVTVVASALLYGISIYLIEHAERSTNIALAEYILFFSVAGMRVFNINNL